MKKALILIDYTNDFVDKDGALTCGEPGQLIEGVISNITCSFIENNDLVVFAIDLHKRNDKFHPESKLFPPHNIENTRGRELFGKVKEIYEKNKHKENVYWMDKTRYSAFAGTNLDIKLRERRISEIHLVGVCTDICVLHTAVDAYNKGFQITVYKDGVASFNQAGHLWTLDHFKHTLGVQIV
ncbi:cysteine hydrolase family protein [Heyndrickxia sp. NPDC080065]|uniref:cysteine hydrolase family protein n=1 Tax=Heyndrickxia sp. NPDC080065 TaxID=3390568 RepID=UPI003D093E7C